jgi:DNA-binding response OmpR family regulator
MKTILVIDESAQFREYMRLKLEDNNVEAATAANTQEGISKMKNLKPDLIILDFHLSQKGSMEVLKQKKLNPLTAKIPVIILTQQIDQKKILELVPYNVRKVFTKPVKIDALFVSMSEILGIPFKMDKNPGIVEVHVNDDIIFIEISKGLNEDKLDLLKFKIIELIELYEIRVPKVIIMLFDIKLTHADAPNMMKLLETVIHASRARLHYIRILTKDEFVKKFLAGQEEYEGIGVVDNLQSAVEGLLSALSGSGNEAQKAALIGEKILSSTGASDGESVSLHFNAEAKAQGALKTENLKELVQHSRIAAVDDDFVIRELIKSTFQNLGAEVKTFSDGAEYLESLGKEDFDLIFLDLLMPRADGFAVLNALQARGVSCPVIVLSAVTQRETVIRAFQMGIKSYLSKPLAPADIFKKAMEILRPSL